MTHPLLLTFSAGLLAAFSLSDAALAAPGFEVVHAFPRPSGYDLGQVKSRLVAGPDGNFYGVATSGGLLGGGGLFRVTPTGVMTTLHEFPYYTGLDHGGLTLARDGNFYGLTDDLLFRVTPAGEYAELVVFNSATGLRPRGPLALGGDGSLYGTTFEGGPSGSGTAFKVSTAGVFKLLAGFGPESGGKPLTGLSLSGDDYYYGVSVDDAGYHLFRMTQGGQFKIQAALTGADLPLGPMVQAANGKLYGTTRTGGAWGNGRVVRKESDGSLTTLYSFFSGDSPCGELMVGRDGALYGSTGSGFQERGSGRFFRMTLEGQVSFSASFIDGWPVAGLAQGADGSFYGALLGNGSMQKGTLVKGSVEGGFSVLVDAGEKGPANTPNGLVQTADGSLYGTTVWGGVDDAGTVFRVGPGDHFTGVAECTRSSRGPESLVQGKDGNFYFAAASGGNDMRGAIVRMTPEGALSTLVALSGTQGMNPRSLLQTKDGNFYGVASSGVGVRPDNVFRIDPAGVLTNIFNAAQSWDDGMRLVHTADDNVFGVDLPYSAGGAKGVLAKRSGAGTFVRVVDPFATPGAYGRPDTLVEAANGSLYGSVAGADGRGRIFQMTRAGAYKELAFFDNTVSANPSSLAQGPDGNFYGTTTGVDPNTPVPGPARTTGTLFMMTAAGGLTTLLTFDEAHGTFPNSLVKGADGNLYGTTERGGVPADGTLGGGGVVFRLRFGPAVVTQPVLGLTMTTAVAGGTVDPRGKSTAVTLQYGTDPDLSPSTTVSLGTVAAGPVLKELKNLKPLTRYYYRLRGKNADNPNVQNGETLSFVTAGAFDQWLVTQGLTGAAADEDADGVANLLEYAQDTDPKVASTASAVAQGKTLVSHGGPSLQAAASGGGGQVVAYTRRKDRAAAGLVYTVQFSGDLVNWTDSTASPLVVASDASLEMVTVPMPDATGAGQYFRVVVTAP